MLLSVAVEESFMRARYHESGGVTTGGIGGLRAVSTLDEDLEFADDMAIAWEHKTKREQHALVASFVDRMARQLLPELCRQQQLQHAARLLATVPAFSAETSGRIRDLLERAAETIGDDDVSERKGSEVAALIHGVHHVISEEATENRPDWVLKRACVRRRQLGRALRRLDEESNRILLDLSDA